MWHETEERAPATRASVCTVGWLADIMDLTALRGTGASSSAAMTSFFGRAGGLFRSDVTDELLENERRSNKMPKNFIPPF